MDGGASCTAVHGVARSWIRLSDFIFTFHFHALEKEVATHSSVLAWRIPGTGEPGALPSMGSHKVGHDWSDLAAALTEKIWFYINCNSCSARHFVCLMMAYASCRTCNVTEETCSVTEDMQSNKEEEIWLHVLSVSFALIFIVYCFCYKSVIKGMLPIPLEKEMATHSSLLIWKIPWTQETGGL